MGGAEAAEFFDHYREPFTAVELDRAPERDRAGPQRSIAVSPPVLEYETLVSIVQLNLHNTATVTLRT